MSPGFAYAQARTQARLAALPGEPEWGRLSGLRTLGAYLEEARSGPLGPWIKGFSAHSDAHALERGLRALAGERVVEVAAWVPRPWRAAVEWVGWVPYLPVFEQAARGGPWPAWTCLDERLRPLLDPAGGLAAEAADAPGLAALADPGEPGAAARRWAREWRARWPDRRGRAARTPAATPTHPLDRLARPVAAHLSAFPRAAPQDAWARRTALRERLAHLFHREALGPLPVFAYLGLLLLDLERLRGELVRRALDLSPASPTASRAASARAAAA